MAHPSNRGTKVTKATDKRPGIQSVELGFKLISVLAAAGRPMMLRDIAGGAGMTSAKAHRYMVSFLRIGLVDQDRASGRYDLGQRAIEIGLAGLARLEPVQLAGPILESLCDEIRCTVALAVWGSQGPTIVRIVDAGGPVTITLRHGTVLSLYKSATGRAFSTFYRSPFLRAALDAELAAASAATRTAATTIRRQFEKMLMEFRDKGLARTTGSLTAGINGFSAPVFDHSGAMVAAVTALGPVGEFNVDWDTPVAAAMKAAARALSERLGHTGRA
jgi:DNA-binding IclR family transcriptional regulator